MQSATGNGNFKTANMLIIHLFLGYRIFRRTRLSKRTPCMETDKPLRVHWYPHSFQPIPSASMGLQTNIESKSCNRNKSKYLKIAENRCSIFWNGFKDPTSQQHTEHGMWGDGKRVQRLPLWDHEALEQLRPVRNGQVWLYGLQRIRGLHCQESNDKI